MTPSPERFSWATVGMARDPEGSWVLRDSRTRSISSELRDALVAYLEQENESLAETYRGRPYGPIDDPEANAEIARIAGWIEQLKSA